MSGVASTKPRPSLDGLAELARLSVDGSTESIERILSLARAALDMDVAVMAAFDGDFVVQAVDGEHEWFDLDVGLRLPVNQTYCGPMTKGEIPHLVNDAAADDRTADLPLTREAGIGAYVGVPIRLWDGTLYGTLCCLSRSAEPSLNGRDVRFLRVLAEIVADQLDRDQLETEKRRLEWSRIHSILERDSVDVEFQPVFDLLDCSIVSLEALARFWTEPMRSPSVWFAEANEVGLGAELELVAIRSALQRIDEFPEGRRRRYSFQIGTVPPARVTNVGSRSMLPATASHDAPAGTWPGHQAMVGSRIPPSHVVVLKPRSGAFTARGVPPLSEVKRTSVRESSFSSRRVSSTWPTLQSTCSTQSL